MFSNLVIFKCFAVVGLCDVFVLRPFGADGVDKGVVKVKEDRL